MATYNESDFVDAPKTGTYSESDFAEPTAQGDTSSFLTGLSKSIPSWESLKMLGAAAMGDPQASKQLIQGLYEAHKDQVHKAIGSAQQGNYAEAAGHAGAALLPVIGPAAAQAGETIGSGKIREGLGEAAGQILPFAPGAGLSDLARVTGVTKAAGKAADAAKSALYRSAVISRSSKLPEASQAKVVAQGINLEALPSRGGIAAARKSVEDLGSQIDAKIASYQSANPEAMVNPETVATRVEEIRPRFNTVTAGKDQAAVDAVKEQFLNEQSAMPLSEAQQMKENTYTGLKERAYGEQKGPPVEAEKALARGLKEELESFIPELKSLNADKGASIMLEKQLRMAIKRQPNLVRSLVGNAAAGSVGYMLGGAKGASELVVLKAILEQPEVKAGLAFAINRAQQLSVSGLAKTGLAVDFTQGNDNQP